MLADGFEPYEPLAPATPTPRLSFLSLSPDLLPLPMPTPSPAATHEPSPVIPGKIATPRVLFPSSTNDTDSDASPQEPAIPSSPPVNQGPDRTTVHKARNSMAARQSYQHASLL